MTLLFANLVILVLSVLTSLRVLPGPDIVGITLAFYSLFILPGLLLTGLFQLQIDSVIERICTVFIASILFLSVIVWIGLVPVFSYREIALIGAALQLLLMLFLLRREKGRGEDALKASVDPRRDKNRRSPIIAAAIILLLFAVCFVFFYGSGSLGWNTDSPDHISYVRRAIDSNALFPNDSFHADGDGVGFDQRKGLWHPILALWAWQSDAPVEGLWPAIPSYLGFFALVAFSWFVMMMTGRSVYALLAVPLLLLFFRGEGVGWFAEIGYSRNVAQIIVWAGVAYAIRYFEKGGARYIILAAIAVLLGTAVHIMSAVIFAFVLLSLFIYTTFAHSGSGWRARFWKLLPAMAAGTALPLAARLIHGGGGFNPIHTHRQGMLIISDRLAMIDPAELLFGFSPALIFAFLMLPVFFVTASERSRRTFIGIMFAVPALIVLNPITGLYLEEVLGYLYYRILNAAPLMCYLSVLLVGLVRLLVYGRFESKKKGSGYGGAMMSAYSGAKRKRSPRERMASSIAARVLAAALIGLFVVLPLRLSLFSTVDAALGVIEENGMAERGDAREMAERIQQSLPARSIIAADPATSYLISAYSDHFVAVTLDQHGSPSDTLAFERLAGIRDLFDPGVIIDDSVEWLERHGIDYLILCEDESRASDIFGTIKPGSISKICEKFEKSGGILTEIDSLACYRIFAVEKGDLGGARAREIAGEAASVVPCPRYPDDSPKRIAFEEGIVLDAIKLERDRYAPGDTLRGHVCWSILEDVPFGLPIEWTLRMDTDFRKGPYYRYWYGKQYRRMIERRDGRFYRFTRSQPIVSGFSTPDQWSPGNRYRQDFSIALSPWLAGGRYEVRISVRRVTYLPNRSIADYLLNEDSFHGEIVGTVHVSEDSAGPGTEGN